MFSFYIFMCDVLARHYERAGTAVTVGGGLPVFKHTVRGGKP
ncbi:hypothetical protein HMPREF0742_00221 [Rothia aeria F0184]|uniref:Uncharacterized protein n=1 Tax=Rothia aeria F0184 TaxID=888019 RepID=U7V6I5_9MICC|nr:hypothetical protein HMPREF0742_00221 [Rothia aeria F0184]